MRRVKRKRNTTSIAKMAELAVATPKVVALRTARMSAANVHPAAADRADFSRMRTEQVPAFWESMFAMGAQNIRTHQDYARTSALRWWRLWTQPLAACRAVSQTATSLPQPASVIPVPPRRQRRRAALKRAGARRTSVHKRATAKARRLGRIKKR